jgi:aryl-alcohol dehydrogenase-like predicted oxidoreductase
MSSIKNVKFSRRSFIRTSIAGIASASILPSYFVNQNSSLSNVLKVDKLSSISKRKFGNFDFMVTTMGLGGQAALQWTPADLDPVSIIVKAFKLGINYFDTSNVYAGSQLNYNKAFRVLNLIPGEVNYDKNLRDSVWLTSKTHMRWGKPGYPELPNISNSSNGIPDVKCAVDDLKRSLSQMFGDNKGNYPEGAYLNMILIHSVSSLDTVDVLFKGLETPLDPEGNFGALVALRDYRDGTNLTGMNPKNEKLVRHIGFSGHTNPATMVDMIQRDEFGIFEAVLAPVNANDKTKYSMQNNLLPVALAKGMGIIAMKVFADAALYTKDPRWSGSPNDLFRKVGTTELPSDQLIKYSLTTPGVHTAIMGIGQIDDDGTKCQLVQNLNAAQIEPNGLSSANRKEIEDLTKSLKPNSNYFQMGRVGLTKPRNLRNEGNILIWDNAFAGDTPVKAYEILINGVKKGEVIHQPQTLKSIPFTFNILGKTGDKVEVASIDQNDNRMVASLVLTLAVTPLSNDNGMVKLFPNPVQSELNISNIAERVTRISICNVSGETVIEKSVQGTQVKIDVADLRKGIYFVRFSDGSCEKFLKQ